MNYESYKKKYSDLTNLIQEEFERNANKYGEKLKCRKGCSQCCSQIFRITQADAFEIKKFLNECSEDKKSLLKNKATDYLSKQTAENSEPTEFHLLPKLPCPALDIEGECMIYEARPVICRRFGPPVYDYKNPHKLFACELNFENGEEIIDDDLITAQTKIGNLWDELKTEFNSGLAKKNIASTSIAEAILNS